jgi:hypothetical protein
LSSNASQRSRHEFKTVLFAAPRDAFSDAAAIRGRLGLSSDFSMSEELASRWFDVLEPDLPDALLDLDEWASG